MTSSTIRREGLFLESEEVLSIPGSFSGAGYSTVKNPQPWVWGAAIGLGVSTLLGVLSLWLNDKEIRDNAKELLSDPIPVTYDLQGRRETSITSAAFKGVTYEIADGNYFGMSEVKNPDNHQIGTAHVRSNRNLLDDPYDNPSMTLKAWGTTTGVVTLSAAAIGLLAQRRRYR